MLQKANQTQPLKNQQLYFENEAFLITILKVSFLAHFRGFVLWSVHVSKSTHPRTDRTLSVRRIGLYDKRAKDKSANDTSATPTVRMPTVRKGQQCEETRVRMSIVRMPAVRCDIGAKKCDSSANDNRAKTTLCRDMLYRQKPEFWDRQSHFSPLM